MTRRSLPALLALGLAWTPPAHAGGVTAPPLPPPQAQPATAGRITGTVVDAASGTPVPEAQVSIAGTTLGTQTNAEGRFTILGVPAGSATLVVRRIGYAEERQVVSVQAGGAATADVRLAAAARSLSEVVITGTAGGTQRRAIGNVVATVKADSLLQVAPAGNINQLIGQRTPGVMMLPGTGQVGTGQAIRIRGNSSLSLTNEPIIYVDGVRMDSDPRRGPGQRGGSNVSALNDIHPDDIESIEIIKGPAAATLYGTEASNGVIQIITKRGSSGAPQWDVATRTGYNWLWNPEGRLGFRYMPSATNPGQLDSLNVYRNEIDREGGYGPIFGYGLLQSYSLGVRGGTDAVRYFVSGTRDDDTGVVDWNWNKQTTLRANLEAELSEKMQLRLSSSFNNGETRLAQGSIETDPFSNLIWSNPRFLADARNGWGDAPPTEWSKAVDRLDNDRTTTSVELRYQPRSWTTHRVIAGIDVNSEVTSSLLPQQPEGASHFFGQRALGEREVDRGTRRFLTLDYAGSADLPWRDYVLTPAIGFQYYKSRSEFIGAEGAQFPAIPITTVSGGAVRDASESFVENATAGVYFQQQVAWKNRLFVTGAVRADANSAFGEQFKAAYYPKLSASWVVHEEPWFTPTWVDELRVRGAWGAAGQQPATFAAARLYGPEIGYQDQPAITPAAFGNPELKPERGEELELGFDAQFLNGRVTIGYTRYQRAVKDAIVNRPLPPSSGFTGSQIVNIGRLSAWGNELAVNGRVIDGARFAWDVGTQYSTMSNEIDDLGLGAEVAPAERFLSIGTQARHQEGYSIGDLFMRRILSADLDPLTGAVLRPTALCDGGTGADGLQPGGEAVPCSSAPQLYLGHTQPTWNFGVDNTITLFGNLRLYARVDGNGGHKQVNTEIRATHNQSTTQAVLLPVDQIPAGSTIPILRATRIYENDRTGVYEAGFLRLREVSATYNLPDPFAARVGARRGTISLGMRNVAMLWTAQHGWGTPRDGSVREPLANMITWDPEVRSTGQTAVGYQTVMPPAASATLSLRFTF